MRIGFAKLLLWMVIAFLWASPVLSQDYSAWVDRYSPAIVSISVEKINTENGVIAVEVGTGFVISRDGLVITANHLIAATPNYKIASIKGGLGDLQAPAGLLEFREAKAERDIAILQFSNSSINYPFLPLGDPQKAKVGQKLFSLGFAAPIGYDLHISDGVFSGKSGTMWTTNTPSNRGESGSPVFSVMTGRVVAIKIGSISQTGVGNGAQLVNYLTPLNMAIDLLGVYAPNLHLVDPPPEITKILITYETGENSKDAELEVFSKIEFKGQTAGEIIKGFGLDHKWIENQIITNQILLAKPIPYRDCKDISIVVDKTPRHQWDFRFRVDGVLDDGNLVSLLTTTKKYKLGDNNNNTPAIEKFNCPQQ